MPNKPFNIFNDFTHSHKRMFIRSFQGAVLGVGAPIGWLGIRWLQGINLQQDILAHPLLYAYMLISTVLVFSCFGYYVGMQEKKLESLAIYDDLTGLYNRRYFFSRLREEIQRAKRKKNKLCLVSFDLDLFKRINDNYGHLAGDMLLEQIGNAATRTVRRSDIIGRLGGEEFAILLPECEIEKAHQIAIRLQANINKIAIPIGVHLEIKITASVGISELQPEDDEHMILKEADMAMYEAKKSGRNTIKIRSENLDSQQKSK